MPPLEYPRLDRLGVFPFRRLAALLDGVQPTDGLAPIDLSVGDPRHAPPQLLTDALAANAHLWNRYPPTDGTPAFRRAATDWLKNRYGLPEGVLDPDQHVVPLAGTKEGLFLLSAVLLDEAIPAGRRLILMPSPLYAVYYGAATAHGGEPMPLAATAASGFLPDLDALAPDVLDRTAAFYLCSPSNPQGAVADQAYLGRCIDLARTHGFTLVIDECYAEIYDRAPPPGGLAAAWSTGSLDRVLVFHSLSKRSSAAGLRSGFVAGDAALIRRFLRLRAYGAPVQSLPILAAATALWRDETHVVANRDLYRATLDVAEARLGGRHGFYRPPGGFFLWLDVGDGEAVAMRLWRESALKVLPGAFLAGPGAERRESCDRYVRLALVDDAATIDAALARLTPVVADAA